MELPDGTKLMHADTPYDPKKAHDYYMRTRQLKGRSRGGMVQPATRGRLRTPKTVGRLGDPSTYTVTGNTGKKVKLTSQQLKEQQVYAAARVAAIRKKLAVLNSELKKQLAESRQTKRDAAKPDTKAEKSQAARESKKYRAKNQQKLANKAAATGSKQTTKTKTNPTDSLEKKIDQVRKSLDAAVARQRSLASATKNG